MAAGLSRLIAPCESRLCVHQSLVVAFLRKETSFDLAAIVAQLLKKVKEKYERHWVSQGGESG